jgi:predicted acylesterase/phospholipase RssA
VSRSDTLIMEVTSDPIVKDMVVKEIVHTIVLSGGGILGSLHIGYLKALRERAHLMIKTLVGTSVGTLIGLFYVLGMTTEEMTDAFCSFTESLLKMKKIENVFEEWGMDDGEYFVANVYDILIKKGIHPKITFSDLFARSGIQFVVAVTNLKTYKVDYLSKDTYPNMEVVEAIKVSCTIPILVTPSVGPNDQVWVDGGVLENFPIHYLTEKERSSTFGCNLVSWKPAPLRNLQDYLLSLIGCMLQKESEIVGSENVIQMDCSDVSFFDFNQAVAKRLALIERGYRNTITFMERTKTKKSRRASLN